MVDLYGAAVDLAASVRAEPDVVLAAARGLRGRRRAPEADLGALAAQLEAQVARYETVVIDEPLTLGSSSPAASRLPRFRRFHRVRRRDQLPADRADLVLDRQDQRERRPLRFHYAPYNSTRARRRRISSRCFTCSTPRGAR